MIPDQVLEQLASASFDKAQVIIVTKMLLVTMENARAQMRAEMLDEMRTLRADYGRLIIEAVEATEMKIFARLEEEKARAEEAKRLKREAAAARRREREAAKEAVRALPEQGMQEQEAVSNGGGAQTGLFDDVGLEALGVGGGSQGGGCDGAGNVAKVRVEDENKSDIGVVGDGGGLPPMRSAYVENSPSQSGQSPSSPLAPVTGHIAAKFDEVEAFRELKAQAQARLERGNAPTRPIGSPLAAIQSLGEALAAAGQKELEAGSRLEGGGGALRIEQGAPDEMLQAAE